VSDERIARAPADTSRPWALVARALIIAAAAAAYGWAAPQFFGARRYTKSSWTVFLWLHAITFLAVMGIALGLRPRLGNGILGALTALAWAYLFIFIWFNSWGT
jgi:hypothetical protein